MKKTFVLDENVVIAASKGSQNAISLLTLIVSQCHRVAFTRQLLDSYWTSLRGKKGQSETQGVAKLIGQLTHHSDKGCFVADVGTEQERIPLRHQKDIFLVQIAQQVSPGPVVIVLNDRRSRADIKGKTSYTALSVREAVGCAQQPV